MFNSQSGYIPRLRVRSPVRTRAIQALYLSHIVLVLVLFLSLPPSLHAPLPKKKNQLKKSGGEQGIFAMSPQAGVLEGNARTVTFPCFSISQTPGESPCDSANSKWAQRE